MFLHCDFRRLIGLACLLIALAWTVPGVAQTDSIVQVKLGLSSMSKSDRATLWKRVDQYATVDALQEFCGRNLNLRRRAWKAVGSCVTRSSFRRVLRVFRTKKNKYIKEWGAVHGEPERKKELCDSWQKKLREYSRIINSQISEAASLCRSCIFC
jgi:hypothetical protein